MSGLIVRVGAVVMAAAALSAGVAVGATPVIEIEDTAPAVDFALAPSLQAPVLPLSAPLTAPPLGDGIPAPIASQTTTTVIPLPPGVVFGLVGLASAAIARRRYLKRR